MSIDVTRDGSICQKRTSNAVEIMSRVLRNLARGPHRHPEAEFDHLTSDDAIEEAIIANEYTLTEPRVQVG